MDNKKIPVKIKKILDGFIRDNEKKGKENTHEIEKYGNKLGEGSGGIIYEVKCKRSNRLYAGKLILNKTERDKERLEMVQELRGQNIIKIISLLHKTIENQKYTMILMEKAMLKNLGLFSNTFWKCNLLKTIYNSFDEIVGDNLLRFYTKQIVDALECLHRYNFVHFDLKPDNLLLTTNLTIKLSDFSLLTKVAEDKKMKMPGGTPGYLSREYYDKEFMSKKDLEKQDYFSLGSTLYFLKYGENMLEYDKYEDPLISKDRITELLHNKIEYIKSTLFNDKNFTKLLLSLIQYDTNERPNFEQIYRNKWLNKNLDLIKFMIIGYDNDEEKLLMELQKSDFLKMKEIERKEKILTRKKYVFKVKK